MCIHTYWPNVSRTPPLPRTARLPSRLFLLVQVKNRLNTLLGSIDAPAVEVTLSHDESHKRSYVQGRASMQNSTCGSIERLHAPTSLYTLIIMKVSFSLKGKAPAKPVGEAPSLKRTAAFAALDDDEPVDAAPTATGDKGKVAANKQFIAQSVQMSKQMKKKLEEEKKVDSTVFQYDEIWDKMQEVKQKQKQAKEVDTKERKVSIWLLTFRPTVGRGGPVCLDLGGLMLIY